MFTREGSSLQTHSFLRPLPQMFLLICLFITLRLLCCVLQSGPKASLYLTLVGILAGFMSTFWNLGYQRTSARMQVRRGAGAKGTSSDPIRRDPSCHSGQNAS